MDRKTVEKIANIAHIKLTDKELDEYSKDLDDIIAYFNILDKAPECDNYHHTTIETVDILRDDDPITNIDPDILLSDMKTYKRYIRGPRLL